MFLLSGLPGSGKSTWANHYQKTHPHTYIVSSDEIRVALFGRAQDFSDEPLVWRTYLSKINEYSEKYNDVTVIADATNLQNKYRIAYRTSTPAFGKHVLVLFNIPFDICCFQNKLRSVGRIVPDEAMEKMRIEYEEPTPEVLTLYDDVIVVKDYLSKEARSKEGLV